MGISELRSSLACFWLQAPLQARKKKLEDSYRFHQFLRDVDDEEAWIREKEPIVTSTNRGRDLIGVQNLIKKNQALMTEIAGHEPRITSVAKIGREMIDEGEIEMQFQIKLFIK